MVSSNRLWLMFVLLAVSGSISTAQDEKKEPSAYLGRSLWRSMGDMWTRTLDYEINGYAERPDESTLKSVTVQWERPEVDRLGNFCTVRGQLRNPAVDCDPSKPIDWFQGLTVSIARHPGLKPDWSKGITEQDALDRTSVVGGAGRFEVVIDMRKIERNRTLEQPYQFGLALAKHTALQNGLHRVVCSSTTPIAASNIQILKIPAAPKLSRELELVNRAGGWPFSNPDGVDLINAVNALQKLGKEKALLVLEEYVDLTNDSSYYGDQETA